MQPLEVDDLVAVVKTGDKGVITRCIGEWYYDIRLVDGTKLFTVHRNKLIKE